MNDALWGLSAAQHGLIARHQALKAGMSSGQWGWLARGDKWDTFHQVAVRRVGAPRTWEQAEMAGCLSADGIASGRSAGLLWRLPEIEPPAGDHHSAAPK